MSNHNAARRANRRPSFTFQAPTRQENTKGGSLFVFKDSPAVEVETSDYEGIEMPILHRRGTKPTTPDLGDLKSKFVFIHRDLAPGDTLASISLQYSCPVSELKRANNIYSDQDFHGLVHLRIPVPIHSLMTDPQEQSKMQPAPGTSFKEMANGGCETEISSGTETTDDEAGRKNSAARKSALRAEKYLKRLDEDVSQVRKQIDDEDGILHDEEAKAMSRIAPNIDATEYCQPSQSTAVKEVEEAQLCGLTYRQLLVAGVLSLVLAIFFILYWYKEIQNNDP